jgi:hypothetical protein
VAGPRGSDFVCPDSDDDEEFNVEFDDKPEIIELQPWQSDECGEEEETLPEHGDFWIDRDDDE